MSDNEIVKAYEGLTSRQQLNLFRNLHYTDGNATEKGIISNAINDIFAQIDYQQAEIEKLKEEIKERDQRLTKIERDEILKIIDFLKSEISRMKSERIEMISSHMTETSRYKLELHNCHERERETREKHKKEQDAKAGTIEKFIKRFEKEIKDVKFTIGQAWEIQCALKKVAKEMVGEE